ncbi:MAG: nucleotidyltransferase [Saccharospirillaceae bacterium]|nr:hypothetical protein [Pseudomonadales bacterium]NRB79214.1 nucleotidyltransferase [Saccharospirillaceae bacterium]
MNKKHIKTLLIQECAKLMYFEGVKQYYDAKKIASKRICNNSMKYLPSNGEISEQVYQLSLQDSEFDHFDTLLKMRLKAIEYMEKLNTFSPRLIGSVSTGKIKQTSDIDLHVFCDEIELLLMHLNDNKITYELKEVLIQSGNKQVLYQHVYLFDAFDIELSVYPENELRVTTRSSTDGKPIKRLSLAKVQSLIEADHWDALLKLENKNDIF